MAFTLTYSNSDNSIGSMDFPTLDEAIAAGQRIGYLKGCPLGIRTPSGDEFYAETTDGKTTFTVFAEEGLRFHVG